MRSTAQVGRSLSRRIAVRRVLRVLCLALACGQLAGCSIWRVSDQVRAMLAVPLDRFPGPAGFAGQFTPISGPVHTGLQSTYRGTVAVTMVDRAIVQQMLPAGMSLAPPTAGNTVPQKHPVLHLIGEQLEPSTLTGGIVSNVGDGYREMILMVPYVRRGSGTDWHNYVVRMYLDSDVAVAGGNVLYGYAKELARLGSSESNGVNHHTVSSADGTTTWFENDLTVPVQWSAPGGAGANVPRWTDLRTMLQMPVLGVLPTMMGGFHVCSYWELNYDNAQIAPTVSRHKVVTAFTPGMQSWVQLGTLENALNGAVALRDVQWRLGPPQSC